MVLNSILEHASDLVIGILLEDPDQMAGGAVRSIEKCGLKERVKVDITIRDQGQTPLAYAQGLQARHEGSHLLLIHNSVYFTPGLLEDVLAQIQYFADKGVAWGAIGNSGISFPYFKPVCNLLIADSQAERFTGALPAAHLDSFLLLVHKDVRLAAPTNLAAFPENAPLNDLVGLASWEADMPCWICNLPVYVESAGTPSHEDADREAWTRYLSTHYNNASFVSSFGTIEIKDPAPDTKDYYYSQMEPVLNRATKAYDKAFLSVFLFATFYDADILDRCLMSIVSQFQRPEKLYIIGLEALEESRRLEFKDVVDSYRHYIDIDWVEDGKGQTADGQFAAYLADIPAEGYSLCLYDTFVLFPQAVRQVCEFFQFCLGDRRVLPMTTAEISRLHRTVEAHIPSQPRAFFREIEKVGFSHEEAWLSSQSSAIIHFTFPNAFLKGLRPSEIDLHDLGSVLPQRLLTEPFSFFLIERGAGYMSFQKPSPYETVPPLKEEGTPFHLANKARALMAAKSNVIRYSMADAQIAPALAYQGGGAALRRQEAERGRLQELDAYRKQAEQEISKLNLFIQQQETMLNNYRRSWYFKARRTVLNASRPLRNHFRK